MAVGQTLRCLLSVAILGLAMLAFAPPPAEAHAGHDHAAQGQPANDAKPERLIGCGIGGHATCLAETSPSARADHATGATRQRDCLGGCCTAGARSCCPLGLPPTNDIRPPPEPKLRRSVLVDTGDGIDPAAIPEPPRT